MDTAHRLKHSREEVALMEAAKVAEEEEGEEILVAGR
jgi:hypothetical protein